MSIKIELLKLLAGEAEAVEGYLKVLECCDDEEINSSLTEIMNDEYEHIGKLTALISALDGNAETHIANGIEGN